MKKNLFIIFIIFFLNTVSAMEKQEKMIWRPKKQSLSDTSKEKELGKEEISYSNDLETNNTIKDISTLLKNNPTNYPIGLVKSYLINHYGLGALAQIFITVHEIKKNAQIPKDISTICTLMCDACSDLIGHKAFIRSEIDSIPVKEKNSKKNWRSFTSKIRYTTFKSFSEYRKENLAELTADSETACAVLDSLNLPEDLSESVARYIMARNINLPESGVKETDERKARAWSVLKYLPDASGIILGTSDGRIMHIKVPKKFDKQMKNATEPFKAYFIFDRSKGAITTIDLSSCGRWLASGGVDKTVCLYDLQKTKNPRLFGRHTDHITAVAFPHSDSTKLFSSSKDKMVNHWDLEDEAFIDGMPHSNSVTHIAVSPDNREVASCSGSDVFFWDHRTKKYSEMVSCGFPISACDYAPDGTLLAVVGNGANGITFYDKRAAIKMNHTYLLSDPKSTNQYNSTDKSVIRFSPCGTKALVGFGGLLQMFYVMGNVSETSMHKHSLPSYFDDFNFAPDGSEIAVLHQSYPRYSSDPLHSILTRYQLNNKNNEQLGEGLTASRALAVHYLKKAKSMKENITIDNPLAQRMFLPEVRDVLQIISK